jgi:hypothetical protein
MIETSRGLAHRRVAAIVAAFVNLWSLVLLIGFFCVFCQVLKQLRM